MEAEHKMVWIAPRLTQYGALEDLTQQTKTAMKTFGVDDDFLIPGISDAV